jgi:subtilase family protein
MPPKKDAVQPSGKVLTSAAAPRKQQYLVGRRAAPGIQPFDLNLLEANFQRTGIEIVKRITPPAVLGAFAAGAPQEILVARMTPDQADTIKQSARGTVVIEPDHPIGLALPAPMPPTLRDPGVLPAAAGFSIRVTVLGRNNAPLEGANVYLFGSVWPAQGATDANGQATLTLVGETPATVKGLYVKPVADYWSFWLPDPPIDPLQENIVTLTPFDQTIANFPSQQSLGWGQKAMKLDQLPSGFDGRGVRVGIIDSGAAQTHRDLQTILKGGYDTIAQGAPGESWTVDTVMHGSHCAGIIAGADNGAGIRGFAPAADVYAYKIFPEGRFSNLIEALNHCIEDNVDVVNLSLGSDQPSELVEQKLQEARDAGIACIVAAGNSGGPVQYPAASKQVLAVSAIGRVGVFPPDSYHGTTMLTDPPPSDGYFSARFSCFGPEIGVCGPGVAIVSSVPPNNYAAWDGTSMATPHITGLAALVLAHHPDFSGARAPFRQRNAQRVDRLFQVLKDSAQPLALGDRTRTGAGLPDATRALGSRAAASGEVTTAGFEVRPGVRPPSNGMSANGSGATRLPSTTDEAMQKLAQTLERAGLGSNGLGTAAASVTASAESSMQRLAQAIREAGLDVSGTAGATQPSSVAEPRSSAMDRLTARMREAGLTD